MKKFTIISLILMTATLLSAQIINIPADYPTIQQGIDAASSGDTVLVQPGTYFENLEIEGKILTLASLYLITQDTSYISQTIIDGNQTGSCIRMYDCSNEIIITGFTLQNGGGGGTGGGFYCNYSNPKLDHMVIKNNFAPWGGGVGMYHSYAVIEEVLISNNTASGSDMFEGLGGGVGILRSDVSIVNSLITNNYCTSNDGRGGGIYVDAHSTFKLLNITLANNEASSGGAIYNDNMENDFYMKNCISYFNLPDELYNVFPPEYCNIQDNPWVPIWGNIDEDPLFLNTGDHPYQLSEGSPCIDAGTPDTTGLNLPEWDLLGNTRIWDGDMDGYTIVDMGAYEFGALPVGIQKPKVQHSEFGVRSYPNPFSNECTIEFNMDRTTFCSIQIFNNTGEKVYDLGNKIFPKGKNHVNWSANNLSKGIYLCRIQIGNEMVTKKIIKIE